MKFQWPCNRKTGDLTERGKRLEGESQYLGTAGALIGARLKISFPASLV
jgi:hypothetical protein